MRCLVVSDVHLGYERSLAEHFSKFLEKIPDDCDLLVLLGDILDLWRRDMLILALETSRIFSKILELAESTRVSYVYGNHDIHISEENWIGELEIVERLEIEDSGKRFIMIHGHQLEDLYMENPEMARAIYEALCYTDERLGSLADRIWEIYSRIRRLPRLLRLLMFRERRRVIEASRVARIKPEERIDDEHAFRIIERAKSFAEEKNAFLIFGHTHRPLVADRIANPGCWIDGRATYLELIDGRIFLREYEV